MAVRYSKSKKKKNNIFYTTIAIILISFIFLTVINFFYDKAEKDAYEILHMQTKQFKDDLTLQIKSDRENLVTMAHFASKLYADGESYDLMFESFSPIGLFSNIGILNPDNTFVTKVGSIDLDGKISFREEAARGPYVSSRIEDLTRNNGEEIIRSAVPIKVNGETVGILYGVIKLETINRKYNSMAEELDAQLFVYDKESGNFIIDSIHKVPGNISQFETRKYNKGYTYEQLISSDKGYSSFESIYRDEDLYMHYSTIEDLNWGIILGRYDSQVFTETHGITNFVSLALMIMLLLIIAYFLILIKNEKQVSSITQKASDIRKQLLEINQKPENIKQSLKDIMDVARSRSAVFVDTDGEDNGFTAPKYSELVLMGDDRKYFVSELFRYALEIRSVSLAPVSVMSIKPDSHLLKTNHNFYNFLKEHKIDLVTFATVTHNSNNKDSVSVLCVINPKNNFSAINLVEEIAVCFSIAIYNKNHLNRTYTAASTDSLTGVLNRVAYKRDLDKYDTERPYKFSCIYIDVNELHLRNNKYGHAAGDQMLIFIANALKNTFFGHNVYRMGGDEFLVFCENTEPETIKRSLEVFNEQLKTQGYNVAIGVSYRDQNNGAEEMVSEAEKRMYDAKSEFYQNKNKESIFNREDKSYSQTKTGILEIDTMISVLKEHYNGIYRVCLDTDNAHGILMPAYLGYSENENCFSKLLSKYVNEIVHSDYHRAMSSFLNYDAIRKQISEGKIPTITYKKMNGESVVLSVYNLGDDIKNVKDTLWVFAKE